MKNILKSKISGLLVVLSLFSSCSEWTEVGALDFSVPEVDKSEVYYADLRAYKKSEHKPLFVTFTNQSGVIHSSNRAIFLPDSIDYVIYENGGGLDANAISDMRVLQETKGTKVLYNVSLHKIEQEWIAMSKANDQLTEEDYLTFISTKTVELLGFYSEYKYNGISFTCLGGLDIVQEGSLRWSWNWFPDHIKYIPVVGEALYTKYENRQNAFLVQIDAWQKSNPDATFVFMGLPNTITLDKNDILNSCEYIILTDEDLTNPGEWHTDTDLSSMDQVASYSLNMAGTEMGIPNDRFIFSSESLRAGDEGGLYGYFVSKDAEGKNEISIPTLTNWIVTQTNPTPSKYSCVGMMIVYAEHDYFASTSPFNAIREAIEILNTDI